MFVEPKLATGNYHAHLLSCHSRSSLVLVALIDNDTSSAAHKIPKTNVVTALLFETADD